MSSEVGAGGKLRRRQFRRSVTGPYDRPPNAIRGNSNRGWLSKIVDPASKLITSGASRLFDSFFRQRLTSFPHVLSLDQGTKRDSLYSIPEEASHELTTGLETAEIQGDGHDRSFAELEKMLKQKKFTRSEIDRLLQLVQERTLESPDDEVKKRPEPNGESNRRSTVDTNQTSHVHHQSIPSFSKVRADYPVSPAELAKAYMERKSSLSPPSSTVFKPNGLKEKPLITSSSFIQGPHNPIGSRASDVASPSIDFFSPRLHPRSVSGHTPHLIKSPLMVPPKSLKRWSSSLYDDSASMYPISRLSKKPNLMPSRSGGGGGGGGGGDAGMNLTSHIPLKSARAAATILDHLEVMVASSPKTQTIEAKLASIKGKSPMLIPNPKSLISLQDLTPVSIQLSPAPQSGSASSAERLKESNMPAPPPKKPAFRMNAHVDSADLEGIEGDNKTGAVLDPPGHADVSTSPVPEDCGSAPVEGRNNGFTSAASPVEPTVKESGLPLPVNSLPCPVLANGKLPPVSTGTNAESEPVEVGVVQSNEAGSSTGMLTFGFGSGSGSGPGSGPYPVPVSESGLNPFSTSSVVAAPSSSVISAGLSGSNLFSSSSSISAGLDSGSILKTSPFNAVTTMDSTVLVPGFGSGLNPFSSSSTVSNPISSPLAPISTPSFVFGSGSGLGPNSSKSEPAAPPQLVSGSEPGLNPFASLAAPAGSVGFPPNPFGSPAFQANLAGPTASAAWPPTFSFGIGSSSASSLFSSSALTGPAFSFGSQSSSGIGSGFGFGSLSAAPMAQTTGSFGFGSSSVAVEQMSPEDSMSEDPVVVSSAGFGFAFGIGAGAHVQPSQLPPVFPILGQPGQSGQALNSGVGSFSFGSNAAPDKANRRFVRVKHKPKRK